MQTFFRPRRFFINYVVIYKNYVVIYINCVKIYIDHVAV